MLANSHIIHVTACTFVLFKHVAELNLPQSISDEKKSHKCLTEGKKTFLEETINIYSKPKLFTVYTFITSVELLESNP